MNIKRILIIIVSTLCLFSLNLSVIAGIFRMSERQEITLGRQADAQIRRTTPLLNSKTTHEYINKLGRELIKHSNRQNIKYYFRVTNDTAINAFALPGGYIYLNRGLIEEADKENELVGVMAHEIAHITQRHGVQQVERVKKAQLGMALAGIALSLGGVSGVGTLLNGAQLVAQGVFMDFSRDAEREADRVGAMMMHYAGWDIDGMVSFFAKLAKEGPKSAGFFSSHPAPMERYYNISNIRKKLGNTTAGKTQDTEEFQKIKALVSNYPKARVRQTNPYTRNPRRLHIH